MPRQASAEARTGGTQRDSVLAHAGCARPVKGRDSTALDFRPLGLSLSQYFVLLVSFTLLDTTPIAMPGRARRLCSCNGIGTIGRVLVGVGELPDAF